MRPSTQTWTRPTGSGNGAGLCIGIHAKKRTPIFLSEEERGRHMHVVGRTGSGKSKLLEGMMREDIRAGRGVLLLDPHGSHADSPYQGVLRWMADQRLDRQLHLIDLNERGWAPGLNYLAEPGMTNAWVADRAREGISKVFGGEQQETMPIIWNWLPTLLHALADVGLTLAEGRAFIDDPAFRAAVVARVEDVEVKAAWQAYEHDKRTQEIVMMAVRNRVMPFSGEDLRVVVGQSTSTIDWRTVMDQGGVVLVNLSPARATAKSQQMLGVMILHQLVEAAKRRTGGDLRRFYVYCDEFQEYVTEEFARALEQLRKFQVSFILAHQHLAQLERTGEWIIQSVLSQPRLRVVFDPGNRQDAEILAKELFTGTSEVTGTRIKDKISRTFYEPKIVWEPVESTTESDSYGGSETWGERDSSSTSSDSHSTSVTSSVIPVTHHKERREIASRQYVSIDEEFEHATAWIMKQADRHALIRVGNRRPMRMVTPEVTPAKATQPFVEYRARTAFGRCARSRAEVEDEIQKRRAGMARKSGRDMTISKKEPRVRAHEDLIEQE